MEKLIIPQNHEGDSSPGILRVSKKAFALVDLLARKSGRSKSDIASRLIEWAYDRTEVEAPDDPTQEAD